MFIQQLSLPGLARLANFASAACRQRRYAQGPQAARANAPY
jgi:hypothetical protein